MSGTGFQLRAARREAVYLALIVGGLAVLALIVAARMEPGAPTVAVLTISSVFLTLAIGGFVYETILRDSVAGETIQLLGLRESIASSGLLDIGLDASTEWQSLLGSASRVEVLVTTPFGWLEQTWPHILRSGSERKVDVVVHLPDPAGAAVLALCARANRDEAEFRTQLGSFATHLKSSWGKRGSGSLTAPRWQPLLDEVLRFRCAV